MDKKEEGVCPNCGGKVTRINYKNFYEEVAECSMYCLDCKTSWREFFVMKYDGCLYNGIYYGAGGEQ